MLKLEQNRYISLFIITAVIKMWFLKLPVWYWEAFLKILTQQEFPGGGFSQCNLYTHVRILVPRTSWRPQFEVLDFTTSGRFSFFTTFLIAVTCSCPSVNDCEFRWFKYFKRESSNFFLIRKWREVLKSRTSEFKNICIYWPRVLKRFRG